MIEMAKAFLANFAVQGHILPLIQHVDIRVTFQCEQETFQLEINNGAITILQNPDFQLSNCEVSGKQGTMRQLFEGTERLRVLEQKGRLKVVAPLRTTLLLESIFFLTKVQENFAKVI